MVSSSFYKANNKNNPLDSTSKTASEKAWEQEILRRIRLVMPYGEKGVIKDRPHRPPRGTSTRVAVISDIHSNNEALKAVLDHAGKVDEVWCLGDIFGYGPHPQETGDILYQLQKSGKLRSVSGNHDHAITGHSKIGWFNDTAKQSIFKNYEDADPEHLDWVFDLPHSRTAGYMTPKGGSSGLFALGHGSIADTDLYRANDPTSVRQEFKTADEMNLPGQPRHVLLGHTHVPKLSLLFPGAAVRSVPMKPGSPIQIPAHARAMINPGSVGQPRDEDPRASYAAIDYSPDGQVTVTPHKVRYDARPICDALEAKQYPAFNRTRIMIGH